MGDQFYVYGLVDPRDGQLRYVGLHAGRLQKRLNEHLCKARRGVKLHVYDWVRQVLAVGLEPQLDVLETCGSIEEMVDAEKRHISHWRSTGARLTNLTDGGEGCFGYRHTDESRRKISEAKAGVPHSDAWRLSRRKLTPGQELEVVKFYKTGLSCVALASRFGMTAGGIRKVVMRAGVEVRNAAQQRWLSTRMST